MSLMKRLGVAALLAALGVLVTGSTALAGDKPRPSNSTTFYLVPPVDAPEPDASGKWTLNVYEVPGDAEVATVSCRGLTPSMPYVVRVLVEWYDWNNWSGITASGSYFEDYSVLTDGKGKLDVRCGVISEWDGSGSWYVWGTDRHIADVQIVNAEGDVVLVTQP